MEDQLLKKISEQLTTVADDVKMIKERVTNTEKKLGSLDQKVGSLDQKVSSLDQKVSSLDQKVSSLDQKVGSLDQKVSSLDQKVSSLDQKVSSLDQKVNFMEKNMVTKQELHDHVEVINEKIGNLVTKNEFLTAQDQVAGKLKTIEEQQYMMQGRMGRLEDSINSLRNQSLKHDEKLGNYDLIFKKYAGS